MKKPSPQAATVHSAAKKSAFAEVGLAQLLESLRGEVMDLYRSDSVPWVIGYSGGKDSTACLQLVWDALTHLPAEERTKTVHVISTDTLVENPVVAAWVTRSLDAMGKAAELACLPIEPHRLTPEITDTFWVNLIGKGYPAPRNKFRWCTERLKIKPSNSFIRSVVQENGEALLLLGTRRAESSKRAANMAKQETKFAIRDHVTENAALPNCWVYTPIEDWTNDDVWTYLMQVKNPWGHSNKDLLTMYRGASEDGECPLVVDTSTPSCGNSRFGCWVCTLVDEDKSMGAMIQNDEEKEWMLPLLELRNELDFRSDADRARDRRAREYRRITGRLSYYRDKDGELSLVPGPYTQKARLRWLRRVLETQRWIQDNGPEYVRDLQLITLAELAEIRRIWVSEKHEIEDHVPATYEKILGAPFPGATRGHNLLFEQESLDLLRECAGDDELHYELTRNLLDVERRLRTQIKRKNIFNDLEAEIRKCFYDSAEDALERARNQYEVKFGQAADEGSSDQDDPDPETEPQPSLPVPE